MRNILLLTMGLATAVAFEPTYALEASDTMSAWKDASSEEKAGLVRQLLKGEGRKDQTNIIRCIDQASTVPGHADLRIAEIVKACMSSKDDSQPV